MKKVLVILSVLALLCAGDVIAQGPLTNALNLRVRTDASGYLISTGAAYTAPDGPLTAFGNIRLRTDANGYLLTTSSPSGSTNTFYAANGTNAAPSYAFSASTGTGLYRTAASGLAITLTGTATTAFYSSVTQTVSGIPWTWAAVGLDGASDTGLSRTAAGVIAVGNGTQADVTGTLAYANAQMTATTFASLGTPANGTMKFCSDCTETTPATCPATQASCICTSAGTGAFARRVNGVWYCTF